MKRPRIQLFRLALVTGIVAGVAYSYAKHKAQQSTVVFVDSLCEPTIKKQIVAYAKQHAKARAPELSHLLQAAYPHITEVSVTQSVAECTIDIALAKPQVNVQDLYYVCRNGQVYSCDLYKKNIKSQLPRVNVDAENILLQAQSPLFLAWALKVSRTFLKNYHVVWRSPVEIIVRDPSHSRLQFVVNDQANLSKAFLMQGYKGMELAQASNTNNKNGWIVDMRFEQQIILYPGLKGA